MSRSQKSNTLYSHPFSKAYWRDAAAELKDTHMLVFAALMIALRLVMKQLAIPITPFLKINTAFFINALGAMVFGPVMAMLAACITDVLGYVIRPEGMYFLPFILTEVGGAWFRPVPVPGKGHHHTGHAQPVYRQSGHQCAAPDPYHDVVLCPLHGRQTVHPRHGRPRHDQEHFMFPIESVLLALFLGVMLPITNRLGLTYSVGHSKEA